jgi:hypothetical protein
MEDDTPCLKSNVKQIEGVYISSTVPLRVVLVAPAPCPWMYRLTRQKKGGSRLHHEETHNKNNNISAKELCQKVQWIQIFMMFPLIPPQ